MKATINIAAVNKLLNTKCIYSKYMYMYSKCTLPDIEKRSLRDDHHEEGLDVELGDPGV